MSNTHINDFSLLCRLFGNLFYREPNDPILADTFAWLTQGGLRQQWALNTDSQSELSLTLLEKQANPTELTSSYQALFAENGAIPTAISAYKFSVHLGLKIILIPSKLSKCCLKNIFCLV